MNWKLQYTKADQLGTWSDVGEYPSGDSAKTNARYHQIGKSEWFTYRIFAPNNEVWMYGRPTHGKRGLKMIWMPEIC